MWQQHYYSACWIVRQAGTMWEVLMDCGEGQMDCVAVYGNRQDADNEAEWRTLVYDSIAHSITFECETVVECTSEAMLEVVTDMLADECDYETADHRFEGGDLSAKDWKVRVIYKGEK